MAEFAPITARRRSLYVPEENPAFVEAQNAPPSAYERMKEDAVRRSYDEALRTTGSQERALSLSRMVANRMGIGESIWLGIVAPEAAIAGAGRALNLAKNVIGGRTASEAAPALRSNALTAEERLALPAPQSGPAIPMPAPRPPARDVRSAPDELAILEGEGGITAEQLAAHRRAVLDRVAAKEAFPQRQLSTMEGEGGSAVSEILRQRGLRSAEDAAFRQRQMSAAEGEGALTSDSVERARQIVRDRMAAEGARREAEVARMVDEGSGMAMSRPMERGVPPPGTGFTLGETGATITPPRPMFTRVGEPYFGVPALRGNSSAGGVGPTIEGQAVRIPRNLENMYGTSPYRAFALEQAGLGVPVGLGIPLMAQRFMPDNQGSAPSQSSARATPDRPPITSRPTSETFGPPMYTSTDMSARFSDPPQQYVSSDMSARFSDPPQTPNAPSPPAPTTKAPSPRRPETGAADSILRRIFSGQDYQSNNRPVVENGRPNWGDPDSAADFFRADRAARELGILPPVERASGGQVGQNKAHKDAALVKALEIIERLMSNGR